MPGFLFYCIMSITEFKSSLMQPAPPAGVNELLKAMWFDGKGNWEGAHNIAQEIHTNNGSLIHAYLHRKEGDDANAEYWYHKAKRPVPIVSLNEEWENIVREFLG
jgi:hypothetical protein